MLKTVLASGVFAALMSGLSPANAMSVPDFRDEGVSIIRIADGCTPYGHRDADGRCRPGGQYGEGRVRPSPGGFCPRNHHLGPEGQWCWPNL